MHSPGYSKPTHTYGISFPEPCAESSLLAWGEHLLAEQEEDENWAGKGFERHYEES